MRTRMLVLGCAVAVVGVAVGAAVVHAAGARSAPKAKTVPVTVGPSGNKVFSPAVVKAKLGDTVAWTWGSSNHTSTDATGLGLWDSGTRSINGSFNFMFAHVGTYNYECTIHVSSGMTGKVKVPLAIASTSATSITLTWATVAPPANFVEDVQQEALGATKFTTIVNGSSALSEPLTLTSGTWKFRARYRNTSTGKKTSWSPAAKVTIT